MNVYFNLSDSWGGFRLLLLESSRVESVELTPNIADGIIEELAGGNVNEMTVTNPKCPSPIFRLQHHGVTRSFARATCCLVVAAAYIPCHRSVHLSNVSVFYCCWCCQPSRMRLFLLINSFLISKQQQQHDVPPTQLATLTKHATNGIRTTTSSKLLSWMWYCWYVTYEDSTRGDERKSSSIMWE